MTELERQTEENRFRATTCLQHIVDYANAELTRIRKISLIDDEEHADLVRGYVDRIEEIMLDMIDLANFGRGKVDVE